MPQGAGKVAIVHDALCVSGGAERVALFLAKAFPEAPLYTSVYLKDKTYPEFQQMGVRTLHYSGLVHSERGFKLLWPLWFRMIRRLDLSRFDTVISSSTYLAKYIQVPKTTRHIAYLHAPFRLLWKTGSYTKESLPVSGAGLNIVKRSLPKLQQMDLEATRKIPKILANSENMANEIEKVYDRKAEVLYPPVELNQYDATQPREDFYLTVSRLISHKRVDLAVRACQQLGKKLVVVGDGPELESLKTIGGGGVRFAGRVSEEELKKLYSSAKALLFCSEEDFGLVPVEAQASGLPVIAYGKGGALETVTDGVSGIFFAEQAVDSLSEAMLRFETRQWHADEIRKSVAKFDVEHFNEELRRIAAQS